MSSHRSSGSLWFVLLVLVVGNVGLAIATYWQWSQREQAEERSRQAIAERDRAKQGHASAVDRLNRVKVRVSRQADLDFDQFLAAVEDDIRQFGGGTPNETYAEVVRHVRGLLDNARIELQQLDADKQKLEQEYAAVEKRKEVAVETVTVAGEETRKELLAERAESMRKVAAMDSEFAAIMDRANTLAERLTSETRDKNKIREELLSQINKMRRILVEARAPYTPDALAKQKPDGKVIRSSAATKTAWLNIGSKHGVQTQLTFSVQPSGFTGNPFTKPKAKLEVVKVHSADLSEARIVESNLTSPVIEGDEIYNPAWDPGKVMRFALGGGMDIDGDGQDDRDKVRYMIEKAGAKIDAEVLPDGTERGEVTVETNFFVRGTRPDPEKLGSADTRVLSAMSRMQRTALEYGAVVIDLSKFLDLMGYSSPAQQRSAATPRVSNRP